MMCALLVVSFIAADAPSHDMGLLTQRVSEDLLREGVALGRLGLSLRIASLGDETEVALVQDGAVVQSRRLADVPADFEAAVSQLTTVVNVLLKQVKWAAPSPSVAAVPPEKSDEVLRLEVGCPAGGTMHFAYAVDDDGLDAFSFDYTTTFQACVANDVTLDGALRYAIEGGQTGEAFSVSYVYEGTLDFSGACEGSCEIDMRGSLSLGGTLVYEGTFCGYDVAELASGT